MRLNLFKMASVAALVFLVGCTTEAAKKAMDRPMPSDQYTGFGDEKVKDKRKAEKPKEVKDDMNPEDAVATLVSNLNNNKASFSITSEEQLMYWGGKPGVGPIVVRKVRPLLKSARVEQRAPALRLTIAYGGRESVGDLIECLADSEMGMREMAYNAIQGYAPRSFGYDPANGDVARAQSVDQLRRWWQTETRRGTVLPPSTYEANPAVEARVQSKRDNTSTVSGGGNGM